MPSSDREFDVVIFGATSYTAKFCIENIFEIYGASGDQFKYCLAGRDGEKIDAVIQSLGLPSNTPKRICPLKIDNLKALARETQVIINFVGPFGMYGEPVVRACIEEGANYIDISGEIDWCQFLSVNYGQKAIEAGVKIMPCMGFDFTTYDVGMAILHDASPGLWRGGEVLCTSKTSSQGLSSGTTNTFVKMLTEPRMEPLSPEIKHALSQNMYILPKKIHGQNVTADLMGSPLAGYLEWINSSFLRGQWSNGEASHSTMNFTAGKAHASSWKATIGAFRMLMLWLYLGFLCALTSGMAAYFIPKNGSGPIIPEKSFVEHDLSLFPKGKTNPSVIVKMSYNKGECYWMTGVTSLEAALTIVYADNAVEDKNALLSIKYCKTGGVGSGSFLLGDSYVRRLKKAGIIYDVHKD
eukprot:GHVH01007897.1.p2 GENE.GHVH01007897.1~~GHVH01007897.1.p2  ORF type:complete len:411 (-),score=43.21 GHVH01007897.1:1788-3020(-)